MVGAATIIMPAAGLNVKMPRPPGGPAKRFLPKFP
jgi:hypothetical protein